MVNYFNLSISKGIIIIQKGIIIDHKAFTKMQNLVDNDDLARLYVCHMTIM